MTRWLGRSLLVVGAVLGVLAFALVGCSDDDDGESESTAVATTTEEGAAGTTVEVVLADYSVTLSADAAPAGQVHFEASNEATQPHELVILRSDAALDALPVVDGLVPEDEVDFVGEIEEFPGGESRTSAFDLEAGRYLLICNIAGHYQLGMRAEFTVR